jgi:hypothetical protein
MDVVILEGKLTKELLGLPVANMRAYAFIDGKLQPIRYQIDEMTADGDWILNEGKITNTEMGNGKLDTFDKIVFMINDTGDKASKDEWPSGATKGAEIEVIEPSSGEKGWCYLLYFASNPPARSNLPYYLRYDYKTEHQESEYLVEDFLITPDGLHTTYYVTHSVPESAGGNGKNFVDRLKVRFSAKLLFGGVALRVNEEQLKSNVIAYKIGPVRLYKRTEQYVKGPGGMKIGRAIADDVEYRNFSSIPMVIDVPFRLDKIASSVTIRFGTDNNKNASGGWIYNSENPQGCLVDGKMTDCERNWKPGFDDWRLITGPFGTFMTRTILPPGAEDKIKITLGLIDDVNYISKPESEPGTYGYLWQDWNIGAIPKGHYELFLEFFHIPNYNKGDEVKYVKYQDDPLKIRVGNLEAINITRLIPEIGKKYK